MGMLQNIFRRPCNFNVEEALQQPQKGTEGIPFKKGKAWSYIRQGLETEKTLQNISYYATFNLFTKQSPITR